MAEPTVEPIRPFDLDRLGPRARRRAEPRASIAIGAGGCALAVLGGAVVSIDAADGGGRIDLLPGLLVMGALVAGGVAAQRRWRSGPLAAAGTVAVLLGVPVLLVFGTLLLDEHRFRLLPIVVLSTLTWAGAYLFGPGRGRPAYLGAAAIGLWLTVLDAFGDLDRLPYLIFPVVLTPSFDGGPGVDLFGRPDLTTTGLLSLAVGAGLVALSRRLDQRGGHGAATPLLVAGIPALVVGCAAMADELEVAGAGLVVAAVGLALALHGGSVGRRATAWIGGALTAIGVGAVLGDLTDDDAAGGLVLLLAGLGLVAGAHHLAARAQEADELAAPVAPRRRLVAGPVPPDAGAEAEAEDPSA
jgi:hypothetical protein